MTILVTGIYGFLGSNLANYLVDYYNILGLYNNNIQETLSDKIDTYSDISKIKIYPDIIIMCHAAVSSGNIQLSEKELTDKSSSLRVPPKDRNVAAVKANQRRMGMKLATFKMNEAISNALAKKKFELEEGRGRPPKEGSAAWHKAQAAKSGDEGETQEADKNIHTQLHKVISAKKPVTFNNGKTHEISSAHAHKALALLQNTKPSERLALQHSLSHSHDRFHETIKTGKAVTDPAKPKITLAKRVAEDRQMSNAFTSPMEKEENQEGKDKAPKGGSVDLTADSRKRYEKDPLFSKVKLNLPPTVGNKGAGGEDTVYGKGKYSVAEERTLNSLYEDLSEENRVVFDEIIKTEEGVAHLIAFATGQGY
jgi:hypothetical protein